jgi:hypothetical protein
LEAAVSIRLSCPNGHLLEAADELAGKKVRCSICQAIADVPPPRVEVAPPRIDLAAADSPRRSPPPSTPPLPQSSAPPEFRPRPLFTPVAPPLPAQPTRSEAMDDVEIISPEVIEEEEDEKEEDYIVAHVMAPPPAPGAPDQHIAPRRRDEAVDFGEPPPRSRHPYRDDDWEERLPRRRGRGLDDQERRKKKLRRKQRRDSRAMKLVRLGLGFHSIKVLAWLLSMVLFMIMMVMIIMIGVSAMAQAAQGGRDAGALDTAQGVALLFGSVIAILYLIAPILGITGSILCCFVPSKTRARPLIFTSLILDGLPLILGAMAIFLGALATQMGVSSLSRLGTVLTILAFCCNVAALVLFMFFVKSIACFYGDRGTGNEAIHVMLHLFVIAIGGFAVIWASSYVLRFVFIFGPILQIGMFFGWIIMIIKIVIRLFNVIQTARALIG